MAALASTQGILATNPRLDDPAIPLPSDRRGEPRDPVVGNLWLIDNHNSLVIRCHCEDASPSGMRLRVPAGYGVHVGRKYELCSHLPGQSTPPGMGLILSRRAMIVRTEVLPGSDEIDVGVRLDANRRVAWQPLEAAMA